MGWEVVLATAMQHGSLIVFKVQTLTEQEFLLYILNINYTEENLNSTATIMTRLFSVPGQLACWRLRGGA